MGKMYRVVVFGNSLALAGIKTSLGLDEDCEVVGHAMPVTLQEIRELAPDVVIFESEAVPHEFVYALSKDLLRLPGQPSVLLIGIDLETNRTFLWTGEQAEGWTSRELTKVIHHTGKTGPLGPMKKANKHKPEAKRQKGAEHEKSA